MQHTPSYPGDEALTDSLIVASQQLSMQRAEMGRILGFKCADFTALFEGDALLQPGSQAWQQAERFVALFRLLRQRMADDRARMNHWLRRHHAALGNSPFYLMVDEGELETVLTYLQQGDGV
ncbi:MAG: DUF2384 domain-containing protein [Chromatiales bacterium]|nr:DUF2384 domain-containing protein [Chromatiales bacterium]